LNSNNQPELKSTCTTPISHKTQKEKKEVKKGKEKKKKGKEQKKKEKNKIPRKAISLP